MRFNARRFKLLFFFCLIIQLTSAQTAFRITDSIEIKKITSGLYLHSEDFEKSIAQINALSSKDWRVLESSSKIRVGITNKVHWISFRLSELNKSRNNWALEISNKGINKLELFYELNGQMHSLGRTGDYYPFSKRTYPSNFNIFLLPNNLADATKFILFVDKKNENLQLSLSLIQQKNLEEQEKVSLLFIGFFTGILLLGCFISLYIFSVFREKLNLWYALYILSVINFFFAYERMDFQFFYPNHPFYTNVSRFISSSFTLSLLMLVMQLYCNQRPSNSKFYYFTTWLRWSILFFIPSAIVVYYYFPYFEVKKYYFIAFICFQLLGIFFVLISCLEKILQLYKPAIFYFIAVAMLLITGVLATLQELGILNYSTRTPNLLQVGFILEVVLLSIGMLFRYNQIETEKDELFQELNEHKMRSVRQLIDVQAKEQQRIAEDLHDLMGGQLAVIKMKISSIVQPDDLKKNLIQLVDDVTSTTRNIAHNMLPLNLSSNALVDVINYYFKQLNEEQPVKFEFIQTGNPIDFGQEVELALYKIIMELVQNILKHSNANEAILQFFFKMDALELIMEENGKGYDFKFESGMGLKNIKKRLDHLNASLHFDSTPGYTVIIIKIPLNN